MSPPSQHGLEWTEELFDVVPTWTVEPDIQVAKALARQHLPLLDYEIASFASGAFNKLYLLSPVDRELPATCYIMRVALPVDPYFKTASEVATLNYIRQHTSIPVPRVVAYDASAENELGFEWILMTRLDGVALKQLWPSATLSWHDRIQVTTTVAGYIKQLERLHFDKMGSIYLSSEKHAELHWLEPGVEEDASDRHDRVHFVPIDGDSEFVIGPVVSIPFFYGNRIKIPSDRGPFHTSAAWLTSLLKLQIASTTEQKANLPTDSSDYDSNDTSELDGMIEAARALLSVVPTFFPPEPNTSKETFLLYHDDLSTNNIPVDPVTHYVTGLVDWECVFLQPQWKTQRAPQFLYGPEIDPSFFELNFGNSLPDVPSPPTEEEQDPMRMELREWLEQMLLRRVLRGVLVRNSVSEQTGLHKRIFENKVGNVDSNCKGIAKWVEKVKGGGNPEADQQEGMGMYLWPED